LRGNADLTDNADVSGCGELKRNRYIVALNRNISGT
jgi:hypothetical protein